MSAARFNVKKRVQPLKSKDFQALNLGGILDKSYWGVHAEYWLDKIEIEDFGEVDAISYRPGYVKFYNPLTDYPDLFLRFCEIGRSDKVQPEAVCNFVSKFGPLDDVEYWDYFGFFDKQPALSLMEIYEHAREAFFVHEMYSCLMGGRTDKLRRIFNDFNAWDWDGTANWVSVMDGKIGLLHVIGEEVASRWGRFVPANLANTLANADDEESCEWQSLEDLGVWAINDAPDDVLFAAVGHCICRIMGYRLGEITPKMSLNVEQQNPIQFSFEPSWKHSSLLSAIWLLFYLKITGQMESTYRICPECNEPIINPRKNQKRHDKCKKARYARQRRLAEKMWSEGETLEAIIEATEGNPKTVKGWIEKIKK